MKVFLSWSGHKSHQVAKTLRDWLPSVIQSITPYVSSEDIDKGARWSTDIATELEDSAFGILCVTKENLEAPWLLFEAGALSKMIDKSFVCPFLFDLKRAEIQGPILQFQSTIFEKDDVKKLLQTINKACGDMGLKEDLLFRTFDVWWPKLKTSLEDIKGKTLQEEKTSPSNTNFNNEILEEILEISRTNQKLLRSPEVLCPPEYIEYIIKERLNKNNFEKGQNLINEQQYITMELSNRLMLILDLLKLYKNNRKNVDDELYMNVHKLMSLFKQQQMLVDQTNKIFNNGKVMLNKISPVK